MLDYSDDESHPRTLARWNHSPAEEAFEGGRIFHRTRNASVEGSTVSTHSAFQRWKERSSGAIVPRRDPGMMEGFFISELIPRKGMKVGKEMEEFGARGKGDDQFTSGGPPEDFDDHPDSFYKSTRTLLLSAQFFAILPVSGIRGFAPRERYEMLVQALGYLCRHQWKKRGTGRGGCFVWWAFWVVATALAGSNYNSLRFKWIHYKTALWALTLFGTVFCLVCESINGAKEGSFEAASGILYFGCGVLSSLLMLNLSRNWRRLNGEFAEMEWKLKKYGYPRKMGLKLRILTVSVLVVALVEHILAKLKNIELVKECAQNRIDFFGLSESFFLREYHQVFSLYSYSFWKGALVLLAHFLCTASWNFKDLFLAMISWTIAERFKQLHDLLDKVHGQDRPISFWKEIREDYNTLSVLTKRVDSFIRKLMFLSMGNNLFFICIQLFHSLKKKTDSFRLVYFFWSFGFLVLRTGFVAFSAARINDESKEPKAILYSVPQKNYTAEVRRFLTQLTTNEVALTGSGFFSITRSLILTIIGSVITYEIVLVQFGSNEMEDEGEGNRTLCFRS